MLRSNQSAIDHAAKGDLVRFILVENAGLKSRIIALVARLAQDGISSGINTTARYVITVLLVNSYLSLKIVGHWE